MRYCTNCSRRKDWPRSAVRTGGRGPCDVCGTVDPAGLYSYPTHLLPGMPGEPNAVAEREENSKPAV